jgi:hemerythrin HHE cation binding domain subfamily protein
VEKILDLNKSVAALVKEYPEVSDIMFSLGFTEVKKPAMLNSVGRIMNLKKGSQMKKIPMEEIVRAFREKGFTVLGVEEPSGNRTEALRSLLDRLSDGEDLESVRADFVRDFQGVDPAEIMKAEQGLMESGMPLSKVQKLCDVHSALFHGSTREEKIANAERAVQASLKNSGEKEEGKNYIQKSAEAEALIRIPGHPLSTFTKENEALRKFLQESQAGWEELLSLLSGEKDGERGRQDGNATPAWGDLLSTFSEELAKLRSFIVHYAKKGDLLYPLLKVKYDVAGPSQVMWTVDDEIRDSLGELRRELVEKSKGERRIGNTGEEADYEDEDKAADKEDIAKNILNSYFLKKYLAVRNRMEEMIYKEENILFPMCAMQFQKEEWIQIYFDSKDYEPCFSVLDSEWKEAEESRISKEAEKENGRESGISKESGKEGDKEVGKESGNTLEDLLRRVEALEGKAKQSVSEFSDSLADGEIVMPGGHLKKQELIAMLNTIPVEITFVDKDNINRFFNEGPKVFKRPQMAIDREVFSCHPPKVEPMVRTIIGNFREGKEEEVPIWMEKGGKPFLVRYMAVRDREKNYVGTLEAVTDMTEAKEYFRQYFKSHPEEL